jgi:hypothetical protein
MLSSKKTALASE